MWLHHSLAVWLWASYTVPCSLASTMGMLNYCGLSSDRFLRCPTHSRCSVYVDLLSPLATLSLKTHIPSGFVLSPPESTRGTSSRGSPARGHVTCPAAAEAAWLLRPDAYEWLFHTQGRPASPLAAGALGRGLTVLTTPPTPSPWFPGLTGHQGVEANA